MRCGRPWCAGRPAERRARRRVWCVRRPSPAAPADRDRRFVGAARIPAEDVIGGDVDQPRARRRGPFGEMTRAVDVDRDGSRLVGLRAVDVGVGGAVDDDIACPECGQRVGDGVAVGDVDVGGGEGVRGGVLGCGPEQGGAELARRADHVEIVGHAPIVPCPASRGPTHGCESPNTSRANHRHAALRGGIPSSHQ